MLRRWPFAGGWEGRDLSLPGELRQRVLQTPAFSVTVWCAEGQQGHRFLHSRAVILRSRGGRFGSVNEVRQARHFDQVLQIQGRKSSDASDKQAILFLCEARRCVSSSRVLKAAQGE